MSVRQVKTEHTSPDFTIIYYYLSLSYFIFQIRTIKFIFQFFDFWTPRKSHSILFGHDFKFVTSFFRIMIITISMERIWLMLVDAANIRLIKVSYKSFLPVSACICCGSILPLFKIFFSFLSKSLSYITIPKKERKEFKPRIKLNYNISISPFDIYSW